MQEVREVRIWHTKRPLYIGLIFVTALVLIGVLVSQGAQDPLEHEGEIVPVDPEEVIEVSGPVEDPDEAEMILGGEVVELSVGETKNVQGRSVTVIQVVEDSRCPIDVNCVQAGRVKVEVEVDGDTLEMEEGEEREVAGIKLILADVEPEARSDQVIEQGDYRFTYSVIE